MYYDVDTSAASSASKSASGAIHCREGEMDQNSTYDRVAENYFQALLKSGHDTRHAATEIDDAAAFLAAEGHLEIAEALRMIGLKYRRAQTANAEGATT